MADAGADPVSSPRVPEQSELAGPCLGAWPSVYERPRPSSTARER